MEPLIGAGAAAPDVIKDSDTANFAKDVITASQEVPVIVDFWAPWCEPCKTLGPAIEKVVRAAGGAVKLVKINVDENQQLSEQLRVQSIPAVFAFHNGQPVDGFVGALPESQIRDFVKRLTARGGGSPIDNALAEAETAFTAEDYQGAGDIYAQVMQADAGNVAAVTGLLHCLNKTGALEEASEIAESLTDELKAVPDIAAALAALNLAQEGADVGALGPLRDKIEADPDDHATRIELANGLAALGQHAEAADQLLESIRRDRMWGEEAARLRLLELFEAFGAMDDVTRAARRKLSALLFR